MKPGRVLLSRNAPDGRHCVDIFVRPDGTFGFELYRRDPETLEGWFPVGGHVGENFATQGDAIRAATDAYAWFGEKQVGGG